MSLGYGYNMVLLCPGTRLTTTTSSPSLGERYIGTTVLTRLVQPGDVVPSTVTTIASWRVTTCPVPAPLSQTPTQSLSLRTYVG
jgi:hypothetical protein